jgi:Na+/melibiose symporter-like transporter
MPPNPSRLPTPLLIAFGLVGLTDPLTGHLSDRSGRRKPWMIAGAVLAAAGAWFLYNPSPSSGAAHLLAWYLVVTLGWTLVEIPHTAMAAELSRDYHERSRIALAIPAWFGFDARGAITPDPLGRREHGIPARWLAARQEVET